ncbi:MAG: benzoate-CoA ligase family protein [Kofleriaceae bacterium]|nr:benzoate-CoA ligase family protein [Kofleriaceae bacterium]MCL4222944.1 benzoate-CoA ligase family protein [Myxococcales bacterium]
MADRQDNLAVRVLAPALTGGRFDAVALREGERAWTYRELADKVARLGGAIGGLGVAPGERVAILMRDTLEAAAAILGVIHAGAVAVPLSELARPDDLRDYLDHAQAVMAIVDGELEPALDQVRGELPRLRELVVLGPRAAGERDFGAMTRTASPAMAVAVEPDAECLLLYSAGFGDELRGVRHSHHSVAAAHASFATFLGMGAGDKIFAVARLSAAYGLGAGLVFPLLAGTESLLLPEQPSSKALVAALERFRPDFFLSTPSIYGQLARDVAAAQAASPLATVRGALAGGEGMPDKLIPRIKAVLGVDVVVGFGLTEVMQIAIAGPATDDERAGSCGTPLPAVEARVVDDDGRAVGTDEIGTLQLRSPSMCLGYWSDGEGDRGAIGSDGWLTTRDRFLVDARGVYHHCGRADDLFKVGGKWVSPAEVERALTAHEAVWEAAVIGADDEDGLIKPLAFVVVNVGHAPGAPLEAELREFVKQTLAPYKYPRWFEFIDALPRGPGGKLLRYKLRPARRRRRAETGAG